MFSGCASLGDFVEEGSITSTRMGYFERTRQTVALARHAERLKQTAAYARRPSLILPSARKTTQT
jgi:hypothetical protein